MRASNSRGRIVAGATMLNRSFALLAGFVLHLGAFRGNAPNLSFHRTLDGPVNLTLAQS